MEEKDDQEKETFYEILEQTIMECPNNDIKIVIGDLNAEIGQGAEYIGTNNS